MSKRLLLLVVCLFILCSLSAFAVDGVVLINQASVNAAGGFPYNINQPGSYKLSGNLTVPINFNGININADSVSLDLNGFTIAGPGTCTGSPNPSCTGASLNRGIASSSHQNLTIRNGTITGFGSAGIDLDSSGGQILEIQANQNNFGIRATALLANGSSLIGGGFVITRCSANHNLSEGLIAVQSTVANSTANSNGGDGITAIESSLIGNTANANGGFGIFPVHSLVGSNIARNNAGGDIAAVGSSQGNNLCTSGLC